MELMGSITKLSARTTSSGDIVQVLTIEAHGDFAKLRELMQKPLGLVLEVLEAKP